MQSSSKIESAFSVDSLFDSTVKIKVLYVKSCFNFVSSEVRSGTGIASGRIEIQDEAHLRDCGQNHSQERLDACEIQQEREIQGSCCSKVHGSNVTIRTAKQCENRQNHGLNPTPVS